MEYPRTNEKSTNGKITVGHTIFAFDQGGMERGLLNLINYGDQQRFRHVIICLTEAGAFSRLVQASDCRIIELHKKNGNDWSLPWVIARVVQRHSIDILHARGWPTLLETAIGARLARVSGTVYGFHGRTFEELNGLSLRRRCLQKMVIRLYDRLLTLTPSMRDEVARDYGVPKNSIQLIANGVDVRSFCPSHDRSSIRAFFGIPIDRFVIGNVGRLDPVKNQRVILRAIKTLMFNAAIPPYVLLIGDGPERNALQDDVRQLGVERHVQFVGYTDRVADLMNCMDLYIQSSLYEGFSNTILEALACGVPVLASKVGGTNDVIDSGREGFFFEPNDHATLASLIARLQADGRLLQEFSGRARKRTVDQFSVEKTVASYESMYVDLHTRHDVFRIEHSFSSIL